MFQNCCFLNSNNSETTILGKTVSEYLVNNNQETETLMKILGNSEALVKNIT